jgi:hypothetical protein
MKVTVAGRPFDVLESTSPTAGRRSVAFVQNDGYAWPDLFSWDPVSQTVHYEDEHLRQFVVNAKVRQAKWAYLLLTISDATVALGKGIRRLASGGHGGSFGFGTTGGLVSTVGALFNLAVQGAALVITLPFRFLGAALRMWLSKCVRAETQKLVHAMPEVFICLDPRHE